MIDKLTIVIPIYNRYKEAFAVYNYFINNLKDIKIIILDNSINPNRDANRIFYAPNTKYLIFDSKISYAKKLAVGLENINTEYAVICAQDDFISILGLIECIKFLENNSDYIICRGKNIIFINDKRISNKIIFTNGGRVVSIENDNIIERVKKHISNYTSTFYSVHRTKILQKIWNCSSNYTNDLRFGELLSSHLSVIYGKIKTLDALYGVREFNLDSDGHTSKTIRDFIEENIFFNKYQNYKECLIKEILKKEYISKNKLEKIINKSFKIYLGYSISKVKFKIGLMKIIENNLLLKKHYLEYKKLKTYKGQISFNKKLIPVEYSNPDNHYYTDFILIRKIIENNYIS